MSIRMFSTICNTFIKINYKWHLTFAFLIRIIFITYGLYQDANSTVPYTDVDYKVFTDASRHVLDNKSPYERHTYRYSPLIAITLIPNLTVHITFGKILFSIIDLIVGLLIRKIVKNSLKEYECYQSIMFKSSNVVKLTALDSVHQLSKPNFKQVRHRKKNKNIEHRNEKKIAKSKTEFDYQADISMMVWLYNPISIAIATRGNCDSIAGLLVLVTLYCLQCKKSYFLTGLIHGFSIHFRLYPIVYSLALFMYLSTFSYYSPDRFNDNQTTKKNIDNKKTKNIKNTELKIVQNVDKSVAVVKEKKERKTIFKMKYLLYLIPNVDQIKLITGCLMSLSVLTGIFFYLYGYTFLYETYIYHLIRKDIRHNFSIYFYLQYLTAGVKNIGVWQKALVILPQIILLLVFSIRYGLNKFSLNFSILTQTVAMVAYNTVLTSQYFVWILVILPLCIWQIKMSIKTAIFAICIWFAAQAAWLLPAYLLEFQGRNTFLFIWLQSVSFFCANIAILGRLIMYFMPLNTKEL